MANFKPINDYSLYILDRLISEYKLKPPFLDIACGTGYVSAFLGDEGWSGKAVDFSDNAIKIAKINLERFKKIIVEKKDATKEKSKYNTILMFDVLEHIENDTAFLKKVYSMMLPKGHLVICVPNNPKEWRWDDEFYGHFRRYTEQDLTEKLKKAKLKKLICYDYSYPFFWVLRRAYTKFMHKDLVKLNKHEQTKESAVVYSWNMPFISTILNSTSFLWLPIYSIQYNFFKKRTSRGNAILVLAKK